MMCNIWLIIIILLIIIIISLIVFSNSNLNIENFATNLNLSEYADIIKNNNNIINNLIYKLSTFDPVLKMLYEPQTMINDYENNIKEDINTVNLNLNATYNSNNSNMIDAKIIQLEHTSKDLENIVNNLELSNVSNKNYNKIKSLNNGMELNLVSTPNTIFKDPKTDSNISGYMVMANNGCLSVGASDYDFYQCNDKNPKQIFKMNHILNETAYQNNIDTSLPVDNKDKTNINYPFVMMKSINNENCLTNNHGSLTVQPCYSFTAQRWFPL